MKTESEIKRMLKHAQVGSDSQVSPTVIETLEWVLSIRSDEECENLLNLETTR